jgi:hypothetical protein
MVRKPINQLAVEETIEFLKKSSLGETPYTRGGLIARLAVLYVKAFAACDEATKIAAEDYLEFLLNKGSVEDKMLVAALYHPD